MGCDRIAESACCDSFQEYRDPPGMLCREQRTALTTARDLTENRRDLGHLAMKLKGEDPDSLSEKSVCTCGRKSRQTMSLSKSAILNSKLYSCCDVLERRSDLSRNAEVLPSSGADSLLVFKSNDSVVVKDNNTHRSSSSHSSLRRYSSKLASFLVCVCVVTLMQSSCARAAPAHPSRQSRQSHGNMRAASATEKPPPKWHNPCGTQPSSVAQMSTDFFPEIPSTSDRELLEMVRLSAIGALAYAEDYKNDYVKQSFSVDFAEHHGDWSYMTSSWLPTIPKGLGKRLAQEHLDTETNLNSALARLYRDLQYYAVGLEQVTIDQEREKLGFAEMFRTVESRLRGLLCEIQTVMLDRNATFFDNVQPEVMPDDDRKAADRTQLNLRQWVIFRDYMNALEFTIELMDHYMKNLSSEALNMQSDNTIPSSES